MKTKALFIIAAIIFITGFNVSAKNPRKTQHTTKEVVKYLERNISFPKTATGKRLECCVRVEISVKENGEFKVTGYNGTEKIKNSVISNIENLHPYNKDFSKFAGCKILLKIKFNLL